MIREEDRIGGSNDSLQKFVNRKMNAFQFHIFTIFLKNYVQINT